MLLYLLPLAAYLIGSVSSAIVVSRLFGLKDPRKVGSGNPGATNILRYGGKKAALLTLAGDILKGALPVLAARAFTDDSAILALVMFCAFLGHLFPVFHGFQGGKGVATAFGVLFALNNWVGLALVGTWLAMAVAFRYSSLAAISAALLTPLYVWWLVPGAPFLYATLAMTGLLLWRHRANIGKLLAGKEPKIGK
ncbi:MAG: glycerol-3-phosphate 1-O-acyltransferase PlsY [Gammaproteobacteria bacterium]|nr:glycerol-3-phosphate 1-O-acyltransferase PlsY [Gammaproteobacteria bacterium]